MEKTLLSQHLNRLLKDKVLEIVPFGRSSLMTVWIEAKSLLEVSRILKEDPELCLDWLENLSVAQLDQMFAVSYFLRSYRKQNSLVLRLSAVPQNMKSKIKIDSIASFWPMGRPMELEAEDLFGVHFEKTKAEKLEKSEKQKDDRASRDGGDAIREGEFQPKLLPSGWGGYPLRKNYVFPGRQ